MSLGVRRGVTRFCRERYKCEVVNENFVASFMAPAVHVLDIDDCIGVTCSFHGTCVDGVNSHTCSCEAGYTGRDCETGMSLNVDTCSASGRYKRNEYKIRTK